LVHPLPVGPGGSNQWWHRALSHFNCIVSSTMLHTHCLLPRQQCLRTCSPRLQV
jgi:hypothetical protein